MEIQQIFTIVRNKLTYFTSKIYENREITAWLHGRHNLESNIIK